MAVHKPNIKLTKKQKAFADTLIANPKMSATQAALTTYGKPDKPTTPRTATQIAIDNLAKPSVKAYLDVYAQEASDTVMHLMANSRSKSDDSSHAAIALRAAQDVLDRTHGKAVQQIETRSEAVVISIDLSKPTPVE